MFQDTGKSLRDIWNRKTRTNLGLFVIPERNEINNAAEAIFENIMAKNFPKLTKHLRPQT